MMFFVLSFGPRTSLFLSLSLSLFLPLRGVAFGIHCFSLCFFLSLSLFYSLSLSLFPFLSSQSLLVLLCRSSSLS